MFLSLITKVIPLKNRENRTSFHYCTFVAHLVAESPKHCLFNPIQFPIIFKPACWPSGLLAGFACMPACRQAGQSASKPDGRLECGQAYRPCMFIRIFIHANPHSVRLASIHADITTLLRLSFPFFFWAAWALENDALRAGMTAQNPTRLLTDFLISREISKVSFGLPEGFSVTAENGSSKVCSE